MEAYRSDNDDELEEGPSTKKTLKVSALIIAAGVVLLAVIFLTEPGAVREGATKETPMLVEVVSPKLGSFRPKLSALGTVIAAEDVTLRPRIDGTIVERSPSFIPGAFVKKGEMLLQIDPSDYENTLAQRKSALRQAEAALQLEEGRRNTARKEYELVKERLSEEQKALVLRKPQLEDAVAAVESARAALKLAELELERTSIRAPFDAQVVSRMVDIGSQVSPGDALARLVGTDRYWVEATVPLSRIDFIVFPETPGEHGAVVEIRNRTAWPKDALRIGYIYSFVGELERQTRLARVLVEVSDPLLLDPGSESQPKLVLGSFVETRIETRELEGVFRLSRDFIRKNDTVWIMDGKLLRIQPVEIVFRDQEHAYISEGLKKGDKVVTTNLASVVDGAKLQLKGEQDAASGASPDER